jgi:sRNA-binding regulator protein Hfq
MTKRLSVVLSSLILVSLSFTPAISQTSVESEVERRLREGKEKVNVRLVDGTRLKGRISSAGDQTFTLLEEKTGQSTTVPYDRVAEVKGTGMSSGKKIGIIAAVGGAVTALILYVAFQRAIRNN